MKITYRPDGLVSEVRQKTTNRLKVKYFYGVEGQRIRKISYNSTGVQTKSTVYVDGNIYEDSELAEQPILAMSRIGVIDRQNGDAIRYELTDHLGNVRHVIGRDDNGNKKVFESSDYYPYGWQIPGRNRRNGKPYRYGYQGQFTEQDPETGWDAFELRLYDARTARWMSIDPYREFWSPYLAMGNNPINLTDPTGGCTDCDPINGGTLSEITVTASRIDGSFHDQSAQRYGFNGTFEQWQKSYGFEGFSFEAAKNHWNHVHKPTFYNKDYQTPLGNYAEQVSEIVTDAIEIPLTIVGAGAAGRGRLFVQRVALKRAMAVNAARAGGANIGSLKNISGSLDSAARLARNQPYGPNTNVFRRIPRSAQDVKALEGAQAGLGRNLNLRLGDPRYLGWEKWHYSVGPRGGKSVVHYVRNPKTGFLTDFKFK